MSAERVSTGAIGVIGAALTSLAALSGCKHTTDDGVTLYKSDTGAEVLAKFGEPDLVEPATINAGGCVLKDFRTVEAQYYFDRGYVLFFENGRLLDLRKFASDRRPELERRARILRDVLSIAPVGTAAADVISRLGEPDLVTRVEVLDGVTFASDSLYDPRRPITTGTVDLSYLARDAVVHFEDGSAIRWRVMADDEPGRVRQSISEIRSRRELAAEDPPRVGMESSAVEARWGQPAVVSARVKGREVVTLSGLDPAGRLGAEITRWYYLGSEKGVHLARGRVTAIEAIDPDTLARLRSFMERRIKIDKKIGRVAEETLP